MKVLLICTAVPLFAASVFAYGRADVAAGVSVVVAETTGMVRREPATMLLSGGLLLVIAGALRRFQA